MALYDDASRDDVVIAMKNFGIAVRNRTGQILGNDGTATSEGVADLIRCLEDLISLHGHLCRLWSIPERRALTDIGGLANSPIHWALLSLNKLNDLCDELEDPSNELSGEVIEEIHHAARRAVQAANNL